MAFDPSTRYLGFDLANPLVASASPMTGDLDTLRRLEAAGAAAIVLPSLFEEQITQEAMAVHHALEFGSEHYSESVGGYLPEMERYNTGPDSYLELVTGAKRALGIPVIASLNGTSSGGWTHYARLCEDAGADAVELNVYLVAADPDTPGSEIEQRYVDLVASVDGAVSIPLAVKVGPYFSAMAHMARRLAGAGADGLVLFNRFYQPDIDLESLEVAPNLVLSTSTEVRLVLRWMAILRGRVAASLAATTGVHTPEDVVKLVLAGADVTMLASALLRNGPEYVATLLDGTTAWFEEHGYSSLEQAKGSLSQESSPDPGAFERANYMRTLVSYSPEFEWRGHNRLSGTAPASSPG